MKRKAKAAFLYNDSIDHLCYYSYSKNGRLIMCGYVNSTEKWNEEMTSSFKDLDKLLTITRRDIIHVEY